jgi:Ankyrin repeats (3 copies)
MKYRSLFIAIISFFAMPVVKAQSDAAIDVYRKNFDYIVDYATSAKERMERIKSEVPAAFFQKKGFYALTKAVGTRDMSFIEFMLTIPGVDVKGLADVTLENILFYLPYDQYTVVKPRSCAQTDTLLELRKKMTRYFFNKGVSLTHTNANGANIMKTAVYKKDLDFTRFLFELNGNKLINTEGDDLLYTACYVGCIDVVQWLVENGHDVNTVNKYEGSAIGASVRHPEIVKYLLSKAANPNLTKAGGWLPLMYAAEYGNLESIQLLLDAGADVNAVNNRGWNAMQVAKEYKQKEAQKLLKKAMSK